MSPIAYFRATLALPLVVPAVVLLLLEQYAPLALFSVVLGGIQYVVFAAAMYIWLGKLRRTGHIVLLVSVAPVLFVPFQAAGVLLVMLVQYPETFTDPSNFGPLVLFGVYCLAFGYAYVTLALVMYFILHLFGVVAHEA